MEKCLLCNIEIKDDQGSPYSVCLDQCWKQNTWGGDTHEYLGYLCEKCGKEIEKKSIENKNSLILYKEMIK